MSKIVSLHSVKRRCPVTKRPGLVMGGRVIIAPAVYDSSNPNEPFRKWAEGVTVRVGNPVGDPMWHCPPNIISYDEGKGEAFSLQMDADGRPVRNDKTGDVEITRFSGVRVEALPA